MPTIPQKPLVTLLLILSLTTGLVDAVSVLGLGKVFTANMTGNVVFLAFAVARMPGFHILPHVVALLSFLTGALAAGRIGKAEAGAPLRGWLIRIALIEAGLLWVAALVALAFDDAAQSPAPLLYAIIALTGMAMGFRNATVRQMKVPDMTTIVLTLTITGLAADSTLAGGGDPNWGRRVLSVLAIFAGAVSGALLLTQLGLGAALAAAGTIVLLATFAFAPRDIA
jgi:uncharacterized membrane protein YoaK (UPF0700 family)